MNAIVANIRRLMAVRHGGSALTTRSLASRFNRLAVRLRDPQLILKMDRSALVAFALVVATIGLLLGAVRPLQQRVTELGSQLSALASQPGGAAAGPARATDAAKVLRQLPRRDDLPAMVATIASKADGAGLELIRGDYAIKTRKDDALARYVITLPVVGDYPKVKRFVDDVLVSLPAISLESMKLRRDDVAEANVQVDLQFVVFVRD
ncbi:MAG: type 4a pilus biogenesis protein PilO [Steroidobacteraceae bacterium]